MFGMGMPEILLILAIALIVIGPKKLPDLAKSLGRAMREFKKATSELKESMEIDSELGDVKKAFKEMRQEVRETVDVTGGSKKGTDKPPEAPAADKPPEAPAADKAPEAPAAETPPADPPPAGKDSSAEGSERHG